MIKHLFALITFALLSVTANAQLLIGGNNLEVDYGNPKTYHIGGVLVTGTQYLDQNVLINISGLSNQYLLFPSSSTY